MSQSSKTGSTPANKRELLELLLKQKGLAAAQPKGIARQGGAGPHPASFSQERLWILHQLNPEGSAYNVPLTLWISGELDVAALEASFQELSRRHEVLRTVFALHEGQPVQRVVAESSWALEVVDLRHLPASERPEEARRRAAAEARRPFDLERGPVLRAGLLRLDEREHVLVLVMHHIVTDGWSMGLLARELVSLYEASSAGRPAPLPPLAIQYSDFARWQREWLAGERLEQKVGYWQKRLAGLAPVLELPTDHPRPAIQSTRGGVVPVSLPPELAKELEALAQREGATLFMVLLAAFQVLLSRYTGSEDIAVGSAVANRSRPETERLLGFFVNSLVLRTDLSGAPGFRTLLRRVREGVLADLEHQDVPFEQLVDRLQPQRSLSHSPLFQVMFGLQSAPASTMELPGLRFHVEEPPRGAVPCDLVFELRQSEQGLQGAIEYSLDLFDAATLQRMAGHYETLLRGIVAEPDRSIAALPMLTEAERLQLLEEWNGVVDPLPDVPGPVPLFEAQVERTPDAIAASDRQGSITYRELNRRANRLARLLREDGVGSGTIVALFDERGIELIIAILAVFKAGGAYVALDLNHPPQRMAQVLSLCGAPRVLSARRLVPKLSQALALLPEGSRPRVRELEEALATERPDGNLELKLAPQDLAYLFFTSGSTGVPKGAMLEHGGMLNHLHAKIRDLGLTDADVVAQTASQCFDIFVWQFFAPLLVGGRTLILEDDAANALPQLLDTVEREGLTVVETGPAQLAVMVDETASRAPGDRPSLERLRWMFVSGEALPPELCRQWLALYPRIPLVNAYGATECSDDITFLRIDKPVTTVNTPVGRAFANMTLYVLDRLKQPLPVGIPGELYIGGVGVGRGYVNDPLRTAAAFVPDPFSRVPGARFYKTGDLGRWLPDGTVEFLGRIDHQVKVGGFRIELGEVEAVLGKHPMVREAVALAREDVPGVKRLVAYVVLRERDAVTAATLRAFMEESLPHYMVPAAILILEAFPLTSNGKVDRRALPAPDFVAEETYAPPTTPLEEGLVRAFQKVLKVERVGIDDSFFHLGGNSLKATVLAAHVAKEVGRSLSLAQVFSTPTIRALARHLGGEKRTEQEPIPAVEARSHYPASAAQRRLFVLDQVSGSGTSYNMPVALRMEGPLDRSRLERTLQRLVERHESLRTSFHVVDGQVVQRVHASASLTLGASECTREALEARLEGLVQPFELSGAPLMRVELLRLAPEEHVLFLDMHHIIGDGVSMEVLVRDFFDLYEDRALAPLRIQYKDFSAWHERLLASEQVRAQEEYWARTLSGSPPVLDMPLDLPRPERQTFQGDTLEVQIGARVSARLEALGRQAGATLNMVLLSLYELLLARYTGQRKVIVGSLVAGRRHPDVEPVLGMFANFLPIPGDVEPEARYLDFLAATKRTVLEAYENQDVPFDRIVERLGVETEPGHNPLFDTMLIFHNERDPRAELRRAGLRFTGLPLRNRTSKLDFKLDVYPEADGALRLQLEYNRALFRPETMRGLLGHLERLIAQVLEGPEAKLAALNPLTAEEARALAARRRGAQLPVRVAVAATFTAEPIADHLRWWAGRFGLRLDLRFAPYNQVFQELLEPKSLLATHGELSVLLVRFEDWLREDTSADVERVATLERTFGELVEALRGTRRSGPWLVGAFPLPPAGDHSVEVTRCLESLDRRWREVVAGLEQCFLLDVGEIARSYAVETVLDPRKDQAGHVPFTDELCAALGTAVARKVVAWKRPPFKVIVVDCDDTLWGGVCGEEGPLGVRLEEHHLELQRFLIQQHERGMLLALCSKNNERDVWEVFEKNPRMLLGREHLAAWRINWIPKSENLTSLAAELSLGRDSFVFLDDNPRECVEVMTNCPDVLTLQLPEEPALVPAFLEHVWAFDRLGVTEEDRNRARMYRAERERKAIEQERPSLESFLEGLRLRVAMNPVAPHELDRVAQLTQRTNQFNSTTRRRTREQLVRLLEEPASRCWTMEVRDRFGEYGLVGVAITRKEEHRLVLDTFLLSCRVLGRNVEQAFLAGLRRYAGEVGATCVDLEYGATAKNEPFRHFLAGTGAKRQPDADGVEVHRLELDQLPERAPFVELLLGERFAGARVDRVELYELDHVGVAVADMGRAQRFYQTLGYVPGEVVHDPHQRSYVCLLRKEGVDTVELVAPVDDTSPSAGILRRGGERPYHLCFRVSNLERFRALLEEQEVPYDRISEPAPAVLFGGRLVQFLFVPGVGLIELLELGDEALGAGPRGAPRRNVLRQVVSEPKRALKLFGLLGYTLSRGTSEAQRGVLAMTLGKPGAGALELVVPTEEGTLEGERLRVGGPHVFQLCMEQGEARVAGASEQERFGFGALAGFEEVARPEGTDYVLLYGGRARARRATGRTWSIPRADTRALLHDAYLSALEYASGEQLLRLPVYEGRVARRTSFVAPRSDTERRVAALWQELLGVERVGARDHFFELGGHSLKAVSLISALHREFGVELGLKELFEAPTVEALSRRLAGAARRTYAPISAMVRKEFAAASAAQRRLFMLHQLDPDAVAYNLPQVLAVEGAVEVERLEQAFQALLRRHEPLRTSYHVVDGEPVQRIHEEVPVKLGRLQAKEEELEAALQGLVRPFDLEQAPLLRMWLVELGAGRHLLVMDLHHICTDGVSMGVLIEELVALYQGRSLPALPLQYRDYAAFEQGHLHSEALKRQESFWLSRLGGELPSLDLPLDRPRPAVQSFEGASVRFSLPAEQTRRLKALAQETGATLYMVLLALYNAVLARYTSQKDIIIGTPVAGRGHPDTQRMVGLFVNTLAMRNFPEGGKTFRAFLDEVRDRTLEALEHQEYPFDALVRRLELGRDVSRNPLFDTMLTLQNMDRSSLDVGGLRLTPYDLPERSTLFDLELIAEEDAGALQLRLKYATRLFERRTVERLAGHLVNAARHVAVEPTVRLADIELLSREERHELLEVFNSKRAPLPKDRNVCQLIEAQARARPDRPALHFGDEVVSYGALNARANRLARYLERQGLEPEGYVALLLDRSPAMLESILATWKAGGAYIPVENTYPLARILDMLQDSGCRLLITESRHLPVGLAERYAGKILALDTLSETLAVEPSEDSGRGSPLEHLAYAIYTSGSTGRPKGAMIEHLGMLNHMLAKIGDLEMDEHSVVAQNASHCFDISVWQFFAALMVGGSVVIYPDELARDPARLVDRLVADGVTVLEVVPTFLGLMLEEVDAHRRPLERLRYLMTTGEAVKVTLVRRWLERYPHVPVVNAYGATETSDDVTHHVMRRAPRSDSVPVGQPIPNGFVYVVSDELRLCPVGVKGEIVFSGICVGRGYINNAEKTRAAFGMDPFMPERGRLYRSGDLGRWLPDGTLEFFGRKDSQVKLRGYRIELEEIEKVLATFPGLAETVVLIREVGGGPVLVAYVVAGPGVELSGEALISALRAHLTERLPGYMVPSFFVLLPRLPVNSNGKVDRKALPRPVVEQGADTGLTPPSTPTEEQLVALWREVLELDKVGVDSSFFELGGHSLKVVQLIGRIERAFGCLVPMVQIFREPTVRGIAAWIEATRKLGLELGEQHLMLMNSGQGPRLFCFPPVPGWALSFLPTARALDGKVAVYGFDFIEEDDRISRYADLIVQADPVGPYALAGSSSGGNLAFEVAQELAARGRTVSDVILLDSERREEAIPYVLEEVRRRVEHEFETGASQLLQVDERIKEAVRSAGLKARALRKGERYAIYWNERLNTGSVPARLHYIKEAAGDGVAEAKAERWRTATTRELLVHQGHGRHAEMLHQEFAAANGELLRRILSGA
jgi:amino acid adenylation domain-containing protein/FkbH-like protein